MALFLYRAKCFAFFRSRVSFCKQSSISDNLAESRPAAAQFDDDATVCVGCFAQHHAMLM